VGGATVQDTDQEEGDRDQEMNSRGRRTLFGSGWMLGVARSPLYASTQMVFHDSLYVIRRHNLNFIEQFNARQCIRLNLPCFLYIATARSHAITHFHLITYILYTTRKHINTLQHYVHLVVWLHR
jgi:hypothetical protein